MWPLRSMLLIPGLRLDWVKKAPLYGSDSVLLDIADSAPPDLKIEARAKARQGVSSLRSANIPAFVNVNAWGHGGQEDVFAVVSSGLSGVMLNKVRSADEVRELDAAISYAEGAAGLPFGSVAIIVLPETAEGLWAARDLAAASKRAKSLIGACGPFAGDVSRAVGYRPSVEGSESLFLASKIVLDSRAGGAPYPLAGIIGSKLNDLATVKILVQRARALGYTGCIVAHPSHVRIVHEVYMPTQDEIEYHTGVLEAMREAENRGIGAVRYRGEMIDYASIPHANEVLREAQRRKIRVADESASQPGEQ